MRLFLLLAVAAVIPFVQSRIDRRSTQRRPDELYLDGARIKRFVPGFETLVADIYWLRTVQYFGAQMAFGGGRDFHLLGPLITVTTTLDPRMQIAYRYGATFLAQPPPAGAGKPDEAIALLERGSQALPNDWRVRQDLGFFHFLYKKDSRRAADILLEAHRLPGAPFWLRTLAADVLVRGGERAASRKIWQRIHDQSEGQIQGNALVQLMILDTLDQADALTALVAEYTRRTGRPPRELEDLRRAGLIDRIPIDPAGTPFEYDKVKGKVVISKESRLWRPLN